jgi:nucleotide-binding universal stress UspA family protein
MKAHVRDRKTEHAPRIVVGVDGSESSKRALEWALDEAKLRGASLHLVHAWSAGEEDPPGSVPIRHRVRVSTGELQAAAEAIVEEAARHVRAEAPERAVFCHVVCGALGPALLEACADAELLVLGTRGHEPVTELYLHSVSQNLIVHAPCPVVVVNPTAVVRRVNPPLVR